MRLQSVLFGTAAVIAAIGLSGCGDKSPTSPGGGITPGSGPEIDATVDWTIAQTNLLQSLGMPVETTITASVDIYKSSNVPDTTAAVSVVLHGTSYPLTWKSANSAYVTTSSHKIPASAVKNGDMVTVTVVEGSTTYSDSAVMPGGVTLAGDASSVSWSTEGNFDEFVIYPLTAQDIPDVSAAAVSSVDGSGGMTVTADLTSPVPIPQAALTSGKSYEAEVLAQEEHIPFAGSTSLSDLHVRNIFLKDFQKP